MTGSPVRRLIGSLAVVALASALLLAAAALAAKPKKGASFKGHTGANAVEGFLAPVTFKVSPDGRSLLHFTFGSFGCFGAGGFKPGANPYTGHSLIGLSSRVAVSSKGKISISGATSSYSVSGQKTVTTVAVSGTFSSAKRASGTITISQKSTGTLENGAPLNASCGPGKITFSASTH